jgi:hypothetical protein
MTTIPFEEDDELILVEIEEIGVRSISRDTTEELVKKSKQAIERSMTTVKRMAKKAVKTIQAIPVSEQPHTFQFQFGIKLSGELGAVVAKTGAEAAFTVTMTWEHKEEKK